MDPVTRDVAALESEATPLGDRTDMNRMYDVFVDPKMHLTADKRAEADYLRASFDYGLWNPNAGESAGNSAARRQAIAALTPLTASPLRAEVS